MPRPRISRPSDRWSSVAAWWAVTNGLRYVGISTYVRSLIFEVTAAQKPSDVKRSATPSPPDSTQRFDGAG